MWINLYNWLFWNIKFKLSRNFHYFRYKINACFLLQCSFDKSTLGRCFKSRHSNESQCPMLSLKSATNQTAKQSKHHKPSLLTNLKTSPSTSSNHKKLRFQLAKERKASTTLGIIMSAFIFCWLPFFVLALVRPFLEDSKALNTMATLFLWLGYANSLLNPIIYATLNRDFRKPFQVSEN